jgi:foldase protein PrsA
MLKNSSRCAAAVLLAILACLPAGCSLPPAAPSAPPAVLPAQTRPAAGPWTSDPSELAAKIDGRPVPLTRLTELLIKAYGNDALQQMVASDVVEQAGQKDGITVSEQDIQTESTETLATLAPNLQPSEQERVLTQILKDRNMPRAYWDMTMRRNAILRKIAIGRVKVTEAMLQGEFNRQYGQKVTIRHIQLASTVDAQKVLDLLAKGADFADLAHKYSINQRTAETGGLLQPFARDSTEVPPVLLKAAFDLDDGQVSEILQVDRYFHIIRRESTQAAKDVKFDDVKSTLREQVVKTAVHQMQMQMLASLLQNVSLDVLNPELRKQTERQQIETGSIPSR